MKYDFKTYLRNALNEAESEKDFENRLTQGEFWMK